MTNVLLRSAFLAIIVFSAARLSSAEAAKPTDASPKQKLGIIYLDVEHGQKDSSGAWLKGGDISEVVIGHLQALGFEVISFSGRRPKDAKLSISYKYRWSLDAEKQPYLSQFDATLMDAQHVLGQMSHHAPALRKRNETFGKRIPDVVAPVLTGLMQNFEPDRSFISASYLPKLRPPDPSGLLPEFTPLEAKNYKQALAATKFPIKHGELIQRLGGKHRVALQESFPLETKDRIYGVVDYALSDIHDRNGYFFLELVLEDPPKSEDVDVVKAAFLMFNFHGNRFALAPAQPVVIKRKSDISAQRNLTAPSP
jgi:hypothetical protein